MEKIHELKKILLEENEIYIKVLELSTQKSQLIAGDNIEEIQKITKQEEVLISEARELERLRELKITEIEVDLNIEKIKDITSLFAHIEDSELKKDLQDTKNKFTNTLTQLKTTNELNNTLIRDALEYIALNLNLMTSATNEGTYGSNAQEPETQSRNFFDTKG